MTDPTPLTRRQMVTRRLFIRQVEQWVAAEKAKLDPQLRAQMIVGDREAGFTDPADPEGTVIGTVRLDRGNTEARVTDPAALLAFVEDRFPGEIVTTRSVRPAFLDRLLASVKAHDGWVDPETSEVIPVPGVKVSTNSPKLQPNLADDAERLITEALAARRLALLPPPEKSTP